MQKRRKRDKEKKVFYSKEEIKLLKEKMKIAGTDNFSAYCRKMTLDGLIIKQDFKELKNLSYEINKIGTNINQIAKNVNTKNKAELEELKEVNGRLEEIWHILKSEVLSQQ